MGRYRRAVGVSTVGAGDGFGALRAWIGKMLVANGEAMRTID